MEKKKINQNLLYMQFLFVFVIIIIVICAMYWHLFYTSYKEGSSSVKLQSIPFSGQYQIDQGQWQEFDENTEFDLDQHHTFHFRGHFTRDVERNTQIILRSMDLNVLILRNGTFIYELKTDDKNSCGNGWFSFPSPGINRTDQIDITLYNIYTRIHGNAVNTFFEKMYTGNYRDLLINELQEEGIVLVSSFVVLIVGIAMFLVSFFMMIHKMRMTIQLVFASLFVISSAIWMGIKYDITSLFYRDSIYLERLDVIFAYVTMLMFCLLVLYMMKGWYRIVMTINVAVVLCLLIITVILYLVWNIEFYQTIKVGWGIVAISVVCCYLILVQFFWTHRIQGLRIQIIAITILALGFVFDFVGYLTQLFHEAVFFRICFSIYIIFEVYYVSSIAWKRYLKSIAMQNEMSQLKISLMLSQMQPHFLYNSLTAISYLCDTDPKKAKEMTIDFSKYLRGNLEAIKEHQLVPLEQEMNYLDAYLKLEKVRFAEKLNIKYNVQEGLDFLIPTLTIQPLVENAVKYGVGEKLEGGTVTISIYETEQEYCIDVIDDGVGFDVKKLKKDNINRSHVGIKNVRSRLQMMCNGTLTHESEVGKGTKVMLRIPKLGVK